VVSPIAADGFVGRARDAKAHEEVLRALLGQRSSVLPLRFGTVFSGTDALEAELLGPQEQRLTALLEELDGLVEFQLRALYPDEEALLRDLVRRDRGLAQLRERARGSGGYMAQIQLGEATVAAFERQRAADSAFLRARLSRHAREVSERDELPERVAAQLAFLVERTHEDAFVQAAEQMAEEARDRLVFRLVGPLPPYSFVAFELDRAGAV
jgi:hypothetical protein